MSKRYSITDVLPEHLEVVNDMVVTRKQLSGSYKGLNNDFYRKSQREIHSDRRKRIKKLLNNNKDKDFERMSYKELMNVILRGDKE